MVTTPGMDFPKAPNASRSRMDMVGLAGLSPYNICKVSIGRAVNTPSPLSYMLCGYEKPTHNTDMLIANYRIA